MITCRIYLFLALFLSLIACSSDYIPTKINLNGKTKEQLLPYATTSVLLYMCGHYGENANEVDAPINYSGYYERGRLFATSYLEQKEDAKRSIVELEEAYFKLFNEAYLKGGPKRLKRDIERAFTKTEETKLPEWISSCNDVLNYSTALINQAS